MKGVVYNPEPKLSLLRKCCDCGHKFKPLISILPGMCPRCGGKNSKVAVGMDDGEKSPLIVN